MSEIDTTKVVKKMIAEPEKIKSVRTSADESDYEEQYFTYPEDKYYWSILEDRDGSHRMFYYPNRNDETTFLKLDLEKNEQYEDDLKTLYEIVKNKQFGFDDVIKDILQ